MPILTFPDGNTRDVAAGTTGRNVVEGIAKSLAKRTVAMALDGVVADLDDPIGRDAAIEFLDRTDPRALELIRHDCAHVLAEAVQALWPGTQVTIGPVIENGFYYDFFRESPFTPDDFPAIEAKMREIIARDQAFHQGDLEARGGPRVCSSKGKRHSRSSWSMPSPQGTGPEDLPPGHVVRPLPRPAHDLDGEDRHGLQADEGGRRLLARQVRPTRC